jgi:hypothetical protein
MATRFDILTGWVICAFIFITPNVLIQVLTIRCTSRAHASLRSLVETLITDALVSVVISCSFVYTFGTGNLDRDDRRSTAFIILIVFGVVYVLWIFLRFPFDFLDCFHAKNRFLVLNQLRHPVPPAEEAIPTVARLAARPPVVKVIGWAGHDESYEQLDIWEAYDEVTTTITTHYREDGTEWKEETKSTYHSDHHARFATSAQKRVAQGGGHFTEVPKLHEYEYFKSGKPETVTVTVKTWSDEQTYRYASWDDKSLVLLFPRVTAVELASREEIKLTKSARRDIDAMKEEMRRTAQSKDTDVKVTDDAGQRRGLGYVRFTLDEAEVGRIRKWHARCWGILWWSIAWLIGFHSAYECFCSLGEEFLENKGGREIVYHEKTISGEKDRRCAYNTRDAAAGEAVFEELSHPRFEKPKA